MKYSFDTSSLIHASVRAYPMDSFPSFWKKMDGLVTCGDLFVVSTVFKELSKKEDEVYKWVKARSFCVLHPDEEVQDIVKDIVKDSTLVDLGGERNEADPFVIALAKKRGGIVVTEEKRGRKKGNKIPDVCDGLDVECVNILEVIKREGWKF